MMILVEMAHDVRDVPIFATADEARKNHRPDAIKPWLGDTVGWWEGDTFVMETINVNPLQAENQSFPLSDKGVVTERLTRTGAKDIFYEFSVNDPETYTQPWKRRAQLLSDDEPLRVRLPRGQLRHARHSCRCAREGTSGSCGRQGQADQDECEGQRRLITLCWSQ